MNRNTKFKAYYSKGLSYSNKELLRIFLSLNKNALYEPVLHTFIREFLAITYGDAKISAYIIKDSKPCHSSHPFWGNITFYDENVTCF